MEKIRNELNKFKSKNGYKWKQLNNSDFNILFNSIYPDLNDINIQFKVYFIVNNLKINDIICSNKNCNNITRFNKNRNKPFVYCCDECSKESRGLNISKSLLDKSDDEKKESNNKRKQTNIDKYGYDCQFTGLSEQIKKTNMDKYGYENPFYNKEFQEKQKQKNLMITNTKTFKEKSNKTILDKYNILNNAQVNIKNYDKWFDKEFIESNFINNKICNFEEMGKFFNCSLPSSKRKLNELEIEYLYDYQIKGVESSAQVNIKNYDKWFDKEFIEKMFIRENNSFDLYNFQEFFNCSQATAHKKLKALNIEYKSLNKSNAEYKIIEYLESLNISTEHSNRTLINKEIDILCQKSGFGIEYNGLMFHSCGQSQYNMFNNYLNETQIKIKHLEKTNLCEDKKIQLFHIFENEWLNDTTRKIWISMLSNKANKSNRIFARKCEIKEVCNQDASIFEKCNHLQGKGNSKIKIGLYYQNELVSLMTFGKSRFNKNIEYELIRFCTKLNTTIVGGASKLLKYFERKYNPKSLISYANRRWSSLAGNNGNNLYTKLGFDYIGSTQPNYFYFHMNNVNKLYSRNAFQKHKLEDKLDIFDEKLTETQNMYLNNYRKIYDSGNLVFIKNY